MIRQMKAAISDQAWFSHCGENAVLRSDAASCYALLLPDVLKLVHATALSGPAMNYGRCI
jgi:hypothetical protein